MLETFTIFHLRSIALTFWGSLLRVDRVQPSFTALCANELHWENYRVVPGKKYFVIRLFELSASTKRKSKYADCLILSLNLRAVVYIYRKSVTYHSKKRCIYCLIK